MASSKVQFLTILKIREMFGLFLFYNVYKENMFTIEKKPSIYTVYSIHLASLSVCLFLFMSNKRQNG